MSTLSGGGNIVTDGLVLCLDAANVKSYPTTGTSWLDLSKLSNVGTLINSPTFNNSNNGSIVFDGVDDYSRITDFSLGSQFTFSCWIKTTSTIFSILIIRGGDSANIGVYLSINNTSGLLSAGGNNTSGWNLTNISNTIINDGKWHYVVGLFNQSINSVTGYVDGVLGLTAGVSFDVNAYTPKNMTIGRNHLANVQFFNGTLSIVQVYNKILSSSEITQNYNATKSRFGL